MQKPIRPLPTLAPCLLVGERHDRWLVSGAATLSFAPWRAAIASVVIKHPAGTVVLDPAFGRSIATDLRRAPLYFRLLMGDEKTKTPFVDLLARAGIPPESITHAAITHIHWDHIGGLRDLPRAKVLASRIELDWARSFTQYLEHGTFRHHLELPKERFDPFDFDNGPIDAFSASHDVFGDGAIVAVPLPGHTPGSAGYLVTSGDGKRWLFTGDTSWTLEGIRRPVHKNPLPRALVDADIELVGKTLALLHAFIRFRPEVTLIPSHDLAALDSLPTCEP